MSASEFEAVLGQCLIKIDKVLYHRGDPPKLKEARRELDIVLSFSREPAKLKELKPRLVAACDVVNLELGEEPMREDLWDCQDYIDFRC